MAKEYKEIADTLAPLVDIILCETMSSIEEAIAAATAANSTGVNHISCESGMCKKGLALEY